MHGVLSGRHSGRRSAVKRGGFDGTRAAFSPSGNDLGSPASVSKRVGLTLKGEAGGGVFLQSPASSRRSSVKGPDQSLIALEPQFTASELFVSAIVIVPKLVEIEEWR